jgi:hypothetical protein
MLSKCANPACSTPFRYLRDGKLFEFDSHREAETTQESKQSPRRVEFFWLCGECATQLTVIRDAQNGIVAVPIARESKFLLRGAAA